MIRKLIQWDAISPYFLKTYNNISLIFLNYYFSLKINIGKQKLQLGNLIISNSNLNLFIATEIFKKLKFTPKEYISIMYSIFITCCKTIVGVNINNELRESVENQIINTWYFVLMFF